MHPNIGSVWGHHQEGSPGCHPLCITPEEFIGAGFVSASRRIALLATWQIILRFFFFSFSPSCAQDGRGFNASVVQEEIQAQDILF